MFITYKVDYDNVGRPIEHYLDSDIMTNEDYHNYINYKNELDNLLVKRMKLGKSRVNLILGFNSDERISFIKKEMREILSNYI